MFVHTHIMYQLRGPQFGYLLLSENHSDARSFHLLNSWRKYQNLTRDSSATYTLAVLWCTEVLTARPNGDTHSCFSADQEDDSVEGEKELLGVLSSIEMQKHNPFFLLLMSSV